MHHIPEMENKRTQTLDAWCWGGDQFGREVPDVGGHDAGKEKNKRGNQRGEFAGRVGKRTGLGGGDRRNPVKEEGRLGGDLHQKRDRWGNKEKKKYLASANGDWPRGASYRKGAKRNGRRSGGELFAKKIRKKKMFDALKRMGGEKGRKKASQLKGGSGELKFGADQAYGCRREGKKTG